jgi:divalent anion:Na+ symporter, DASS family
VSKSLRGFAILLGIFLVIAFLIPRPAAVEPAGWRIVAVFVATVVGLVIEPIPGGGVVLIAVTATTMVGKLPISKALEGYADPTVWLVVAAFFISRALINTGLARRIALIFIRAVGGTPLGIAYALSASDFLLATVVPSISARSAGIIVPIFKSIADLYGSRPGETAKRLGAYLVTSIYQVVCITAATFYTGQASNPLAAGIAKTQANYTITWSSWFAAGIVPGLVSFAVVPWIIRKIYPPELTATPEAPKFAAEELRRMGPLSQAERILTAVFVMVAGGWATGSWHGLDAAVVALIGSCVLLLANVISWEDVRSERAAWDIFVWYGGIVMLGRAMNDTGVTRAFADSVVGMLAWASWPVLLALALLIYFYVHYFFASLTAHVLAMYPPFLAVLFTKSAPIGLVVFSFACFVNLAAGLTHYGTTPAPVYYACDYVPMKDWWRIGAIISVVNIAIWSTVGFGWWKLIGIW